MARKKKRPQRKADNEIDAAPIPKKVRRLKNLEKDDEEITVQVHLSSTKQPYHLGSFEVSLISTVIISAPEFTIKVREDGSGFVLLNEYHTESNQIQDLPKINILQSTCKIPHNILQILTSSNLFNFFLHNFSSELVGTFDVDVCIDPSQFISLKEASSPAMNRHKSSIYKVLQHFVDPRLEMYESNHFYDEDQIQKIYSCIHNSYNPDDSSPEFKHEAFIPKLRPYQCQAVSWMLKRENENYSSVPESYLHQLYVAITLKDGNTLYFHKHGGFFVDKKYAPDKPCRGGLLADEMGLGKTLEVLALILMNPRPLAETESNKEVSSKSRILSDTNLNIELGKKEEILFEDENEDPNGRFQEQNDLDSFGCYCGNINNCSSVARCVRCKVIQHPACMLYGSDTYKDNYLCPFCLEKDSVSSRSTLIISPASILQQWKMEILNHIKKNYLKVFLYEGVEHQKFVKPEILAKFDIVLVSYETLKKELLHVDITYGRAGHPLRKTKKFLSIPSPLCSVEWWRICLDEAQMVENVTNNVAKMVNKLNSINRWCVSGTPVKKSIEDLYGLFVFLNIQPYNEKLWWNEGIIKSFASENMEPLSTALNTIAWATMKYQVFNQIGICEVKEVIEKLKFSPVEKVYYDKKHVDCYNNFLENVKKYAALQLTLKCLDKRILTKILNPMKILQQVCCHFQITQENVDINKKRMSTSELLSKLLKNVSYECEQIHRQYIMTRNGLAGLFMVEKDYKSAVEIFEKSLQSVEDNKEHIRTDATQQIHCLFHLSNALKLSEKEGKNVESKFKPSELDKKVNELTEHYFEKSRIALFACKKDYTAIQKHILKNFKNLSLKRDPFPTSSWWCDLFNNISEKQRDIFLESLPEVLDKATSGSPVVVMKDIMLKKRFSQYSLPALHDLLLHFTCELHSERKALLNIVEDLAQEPDDSTLKSAISCHLRPIVNSPKCKFCSAEDVFKSYESKLYIIEETTVVKHCEYNLTEKIVCRNRKYPSGPLEICLDYVNKYLSTLTSDSQINVALKASIINDSLWEMRLMGNLKKEYQVLRNIWKKYYDFVSELDQIEMAKISVEMIPTNQKKPDSAASYCLYPHEVQNNKLQYHSDVIENESELKRKLGKLYYLKNLEKSEKKGSPFEEECPICRLKIEVAWYVLQCGHCICVSCTENLKHFSGTPPFNSRKDKGGFHCPLCRQFNPYPSLNFLIAENEEENDKIPLKNFYSTKVNAVVRCLMQLQNDEPEAKSLVFSTFIGLLDILQGALEENNIGSYVLCNNKHFQEVLDKFKTEPEVKVLLIPLNFGHSGLNITEANHVLLLEPVLDNSLHLQAIGRVHRIGQKKQVTIHRFIVKDSIEERIHEAISSSGLKENLSSGPCLTFMDLRDAFEKIS